MWGVGGGVRFCNVPEKQEGGKKRTDDQKGEDTIRVELLRTVGERGGSSQEVPIKGKKEWPITWNRRPTETTSEKKGSFGHSMTRAA